MLSWFGEAFLYSATAVALGTDVLLHIFQNEGRRLALNLLILCTASILTMPAYFILSGGVDNSLLIVFPDDSGDGSEAIGTGYIIIMLVSALYIILYILTCCTCDCKDRKLMRIGLCVFLMIGGLITAIGYYVYAGGNDGFQQLGEKSDEAKRIAYYIGYTGLIGSLCFFWGIDIAWDDIKERPQK